MSINIAKKLSRTGVRLDWTNEITSIRMIYEGYTFTYPGGGVNAVVRYLRKNPMLTYEERKANQLHQGKDHPEYVAEIEQEYAITEENEDTVRRINGHVILFNRAA